MCVLKFYLNTKQTENILEMKVLILMFFTILLITTSINSEISNGETDVSRRLDHINVSTSHSGGVYTNGPTVKSVNLKLPFNQYTNDEFTNLTRISDMLNVFNVQNIGSFWNVLDKHLNRNCSKDMYDYLEGLRNGKIWALKSKFICSFYNVLR